MSAESMHSLTLPVGPGRSPDEGSGDRALGSSNDFMFKITYFNDADCILFVVIYFITKTIKVCFEFLW